MHTTKQNHNSNNSQDSPSASKIKEAFFSERGLAGGVQKLPLEKVFELDSVKKVRKERAAAFCCCDCECVCCFFCL